MLEEKLIQEHFDGIKKNPIESLWGFSRKCCMGHREFFAVRPGISPWMNPREIACEIEGRAQREELELTKIIYRRILEVIRKELIGKPWIDYCILYDFSEKKKILQKLLQNS